MLKEQAMRRLDGKVALVTGAARSGSIGRAIALELAREGADVAVNDLDRNAEAKDLAAEIERMGRRAQIVMADVRKVAECRHLIDDVVRHFGRLDILVNNAGQAQRKAFEDLSKADYDASLDLHLKGPFFLAQAAVSHMRIKRWG